MSKLRVHNFVVSLDGYASGETQSLDAAFGHAQREFLDWFGNLRTFHGGQPDGKLGPDEAIASAWGTAIGAQIMGRNRFRPTTGPRPDDGWPGWWGEEPPFHTPCFVMTHWEREPIKVGETTYYFVNSSPADVLKRAQEAAGGLDLRLGADPPPSMRSWPPTYWTTCMWCWCRSCSGGASRFGTVCRGCTNTTPSRWSPCPAGPPTCSSRAEWRSVARSARLNAAPTLGWRGQAVG